MKDWATTKRSKRLLRIPFERRRPKEKAKAQVMSPRHFRLILEDDMR